MLLEHCVCMVANLQQFLQQIGCGCKWSYKVTQECLRLARMAELVYAFDLKSNGEIHMGSSLIPGTNRGRASLLCENGSLLGCRFLFLQQFLQQN